MNIYTAVVAIVVSISVCITISSIVHDLSLVKRSKYGENARLAEVRDSDAGL